jgi:ribonuclease BN (tRNA processing enzyme)
MNIHTMIYSRVEGGGGDKGQRGGGNRGGGGVYLKVRSIQVPHCRESYGIVLDVHNNHDICSNNASGVYSNMNGNVDSICNIPKDGSGMNRNMIGNVDVTKMKVVYSGDCRPSQALITAGDYMHVYIHVRL